MLQYMVYSHLHQSIFNALYSAGDRNGVISDNTIYRAVNVFSPWFIFFAHSCCSVSIFTLLIFIFIVTVEFSLFIEHFCVNSAPLIQFFVRSIPHNTAVVKYSYLICKLQGWKAMRYEHCAFVGNHAVKLGVYFIFRHRIQCLCRFVQQTYRAVMIYGSCYRKLLLLSAG